MEVMVEDGSNDPWSCQLSRDQIDRAPGPDSVGIEWSFSLWTRAGGGVHKCIELPAYFQLVPKLPWCRRIVVE